MDELDRAHRASSKHWHEVESSPICGCFDCLASFQPGTITEWVDDDQTALCPRCGIDAVIGAASGWPISEEFLRRMRLRFF